MIVDRKLNSRNQLSTINYQLSVLRFSQKFLPDVKVGIFRKKNVGGKDPARSQIAGGDAFLVLDVFPWINENRSGFVFDCMVLRPFGQDSVGGVKQLNLDSLVVRKIELDHVIAAIGYGRLDLHLSNLRQPHWLRGDLEVENQSAQ